MVFRYNNVFLAVAVAFFASSYLVAASDERLVSVYFINQQEQTVRFDNIIALPSGRGGVCPLEDIALEAGKTQVIQVPLEYAYGIAFDVSGHINGQRRVTSEETGKRSMSEVFNSPARRSIAVVVASYVPQCASITIQKDNPELAKMLVAQAAADAVKASPARRTAAPTATADDLVAGYATAGAGPEDAADDETEALDDEATEMQAAAASGLAWYNPWRLLGY